MIFMDSIVAVHGILAKEVPESQKDLDLLVRSEYYHVLLALFSGWGSHPVPQEWPKFSKVNVNWVRPTSAIILESPNLTIRCIPRPPRGSLPWQHAARVVRVEKLIIDHPPLGASIKHETPMR